MNNLMDSAYLEMAYGLAEKALGQASPNPYVGALVVKNGIILGHGYHEGAGKPHAEIVALRRAGSRTKNGTLYVTLEPCVHWGRTPPCADAILQARPKRVVVSALDPNPLVLRKGVAKLKQAGIEVSTGLLEDRNRRLNENYIKYITQKVPFVTLKAALSLDGKMATKKFDSRWISSEATREYAHLLRGEYDALMIGSGTLLKDDPRLTVRHPNWRDKRLTRVILDPGLLFPLRARILSTLSRGRILVFTNAGASPQKRAALEKRGAEVIAVPGTSLKLDLNEVLLWLGNQEISSVLVEGGGSLATSLLDKNLVDKVFLTISPKLIGGANAVAFYGGRGADRIKETLRLKRFSTFELGEDIIAQGYL
jgi:diaminohydroxyphosphoribosylaminopyrimidine deaminase/5-amino-6-(5-phosphoribosylamino)uracil reductase